MALDFASIEAKWRKAWYDAKINESEPAPGKKKFFMIFAYPGVTGYLHVGHMRGYTFSDAVVRYKKMTGGLREEIPRRSTCSGRTAARMRGSSPSRIPPRSSGSSMRCM
ncbi:MAG: class I tRNA ligase family protein [Thermoplasmata archaeon]|nr:class I tRNA ligase family protein [Thermoplasmata archaeon]